MSIDRLEIELLGILAELRKLPRETEWAEFKHNNAEPDEIGEYLSALANAAAMTGKVHAWLVWGVDNDTHEVIGQALRKQVPMFPELAIRELVANAIIHQDFHITGTGPMVEIFAGRMEITNPGLPLVQTDRFLDSPPRSRNEALASFMRRIGVCEERGSGIDKVVIQTEIFQLPAPIFETTVEHTRAVLFAHREFKAMDKSDRIRACYLHACLRYVQRDYMTNTTLRERFGIEEKNSSMVSRIIRDTVEAGLIVPYDEAAGRKYMKYLPWWAR